MSRYYILVVHIMSWYYTWILHILYCLPTLLLSAFQQYVYIYIGLVWTKREGKSVENIIYLSINLLP